MEALANIVRSLALSFGVFYIVIFLIKIMKSTFQLLGFISKKKEIKTGVFYQLLPTQNWALALAHPMAEKNIEQGYAEDIYVSFSDDIEETIRPVLLYYFELRTDMKDGEIQVVLSEKIRKDWYRIDMNSLRCSDDRRIAMAFSCARIAFSVRTAYLLGWLNEEEQWFVLELNAQRARECFTSWDDYGMAWAEGRKQWVIHARADSLGLSFDKQKIDRWTKDNEHPWNTIPWSSVI